MKRAWSTYSTYSALHDCLEFDSVPWQYILQTCVGLAVPVSWPVSPFTKKKTPTHIVSINKPYSLTVKGNVTHFNLWFHSTCARLLLLAKQALQSISYVPVVTPYIQHTIRKSIKSQTQLVFLRMFTFGNGYFKCHRARGDVVAKTLRYKPAGRGFDSQWYHWKFSVT
jgi:hypothetical protein